VLDVVDAREVFAANVREAIEAFPEEELE